MKILDARIAHHEKTQLALEESLQRYRLKIAEDLKEIGYTMTSKALHNRASEISDFEAKLLVEREILNELNILRLNLLRLNEVKIS